MQAAPTVFTNAPVNSKPNTLTMQRFLKRTSAKAGLPPGSLVHIGEQQVETARVNVTRYSVNLLEERENVEIDDSLASAEDSAVNWIHVDGLHDLSQVEALGRLFGIHPLTLEDVVNTGQRPKAEDFEDYIFMVFKMLAFDSVANQVAIEQVSIVLGEQFLVSFLEKSGEVFTPVRRRLRDGQGRIRRSGSGYLAYALMDAVVDNYFEVLETIGDRIEALEEELIEQPTPATLHAIHGMKREMLHLRKLLWPMRDVIRQVTESGTHLLHEDHDLFWADVHDHILQAVDIIDSYRGMLSSMHDLYLSTISMRMNEIMRMLTLIATIFIPITFVVGVYGMNFKFMPELEWRWGYAAVWGIIGVVVVGMIAFFKKKKWF